MALIFMDGFDHYTDAYLLKKWTSRAGSGQFVDPTAGRRGGGAVVLSNSSSAIITKNLGGNYSTLTMGAAVSFSTVTPGSALAFLSFRDAATDQIVVRLTPSGNLAIYRGTTLVATSTQVITSGYHYIESKITFHGTAGAYELRVDGTTWLTASGVNTIASANAYANTIVLGTVSGTGLTSTFDDLYVCDDTGTVNNDFLGDVRIDLMPLGTEGTHTDFTNSVDQVTLDATHAYWRIAVNATGPSGTAFYEVEMRATVGGADQCSGGTATASGGTAANAFDNSTASQWFTSSQSGWLQYQFASPVSVKELQLTGPDSGGLGYGVRAFTLQASDDGVTWVSMATFFTPAWTTNKEVRTFAVPAASAKISSVDGTFPFDPPARYLVGGSAGTKESFTLADNPNLPLDNLVVAVAIHSYVSKTDAGGSVVRNLVRSGTSESVGSQLALSTSYQYASSIHEIDPATGAPWTLNAAKAMEVGVDVVS